MTKRFLSTSEAAKILGISRIAVFKKIQKGRLPALLVGGSYVISAAAVEHERRRRERKDRKERSA